MANGNGKPKRKPGRPKKDISVAMVRSLAKIGCTYAEMAGILKCSSATLYMRFQTEIEQETENLKKSLRRKQLAVARQGNVQMLIWLGKQYLGQRDKSEIALGIGELYADPLDTYHQQRAIHGSDGNSNGNGHSAMAQDGNGRTPRIPPPASD